MTNPNIFHYPKKCLSDPLTVFIWMHENNVANKEP